MIEPQKYLDENPEIGKVLYYPGAFEDFGLIEFFLNNSSIDTFIYTDYTPDKIDIQSGLNSFIKHSFLRHPMRLEPAFFNKKNWDEFWSDDEDSKFFGHPNNAKAYKYDLESDNGKLFTLIYLFTDAIETYKIICENNFIPDVIVLQDHGTGGNYSYFGGAQGDEKVPSKLYNYAEPHLPEYIFMEPESNTTIWPGYEIITNQIELKGPMHKNKRALYKRI